MTFAKATAYEGQETCENSSHLVENAAQLGFTGRAGLLCIHPLFDMLVHVGRTEWNCVGIDRLPNCECNSKEPEHKGKTMGYETECGWCSELWSAGQSHPVGLRKGIAFELFSTELGLERHRAPYISYFSVAM